ncbi:hypothetical protein SESBI_08251 [Sesbania bispinosa]|nr:hypothetical protein SESBI_08251 [Sesbania bispinosa]
MDILNVSSPSNFPIPTFCHPKTLHPKVHNIPSFPSHRNPFSLYLSSPTTTKFRTWAHFGRPTTRRNSLRKKLLHDHQDSFGGVKSVSVDEEEILLRSRVQRDVIEDFPEVKKKILYAKNLAREMENGNDVIPRNSSVAKFVVQVIPEPLETPLLDIKKPKIDKEQLKDKILKAKASADKLVVQDSSAEVRIRSMDMDYKVQEIREMARQARRIEGRDHSLVSRDMEMDDPAMIEKSSNEIEVIKKNSEQDNSLSNHQNEVAMETTDSNPILQTTSVDVTENIDNPVLHEVVPVDDCTLYASNGDREINKQEIEMNENAVYLKDREDNMYYSDNPINGSSMRNESSVNKRPRIIRSVKEARDYLSKKHDKQVPDTESKIELVKENIADLKPLSAIDFNDQRCQDLEMDTIMSRSDTLNGISDSKPAINANGDSNQKDKKLNATKNDCLEDSSIEPGLEGLKKYEAILDLEVNGTGTEAWVSVEKNLHEVEPAIEQIRSDTLNGISDSKPAIDPIEDSNQKDNASEDSNQRDTELSETKNDCLNDSNIEPGLEDLQKSETTLDGEFNGTGTEAQVSVEKNLHGVEPTIKQIRTDALNGISDSKPAIDPIEDSNQKDKEFDPTKDDYFKDSVVESGVGDIQKSETTFDREVNGVSTEKKLTGKTENWLEKNFHEVEPIIKKIRAGFRDNYMVAKERVDQPLDIPTEMESLGVVEDGGELDWMQNDHLRDIVFRVRENELSGRDPFYLINDEDKEAFFRGLEKKVEQENKKLSHIHEWLHSNIENLDYGADGISIYDPPEKIIPRWKGPPVEKVPEFLNEFLDKRKTISTKNMNPVKKDENVLAKKSASSSLQEKVNGSITPITKSKNPKTVIEGSDGSVKVGKKSGKEFWQHTKKWSQGFLESYNAETDPETKSIMKDIGKDLDRWITEKEIEEAADLMNKLPDRNRSFMEKKLNKLKREMELFGPQAVVSKYREYADDKEEDYLWWLDLPYVLCIELYTIDDGEQRVGFYSLEMAGDLELEPKPYHVIAFQDPSDCKNLCYIIQAHMEMLGNGNAFVVAQPPKDAFREAKANGFGVTVIKKGELQLNIDQPLEEVEEQITEIGSKMYHDMMMKERSVDINSIMKGVFGFSDSSSSTKGKSDFICLNKKVKAEIEETQKGMMALKLSTI